MSNLKKFKKDGTAVVLGAQNVCSFENMERDGIRIIRPIKPLRPNQNKPRFSFTNYRHPETGEIMGIPISENPNGTFNFKRITINGGKAYDLSKEEEAKEYHVVKDCCFIRGGAAQKAIAYEPTFFIFNEEEEATKYVEKRKKAINIEQQINEMSDSQIAEFGMLFNINPQNHSTIVIRQMLLEKLYLNPELVALKTENIERSNINIIYKRGMFTGIITERLNDGVYYHGIHLGPNEHAAIDKLMDNKTLVANIDAESKQIASKSGFKMPSITTDKRVKVNKIKEEEKENENSISDKKQIVKEVVSEIMPQIKEMFEKLNMKQKDDDKTPDDSIDKSEKNPFVTNKKSGFREAVKTEKEKAEK